MPVDDDSAAHTGPDGDEHSRSATPSSTELRLADGERPRVVDEHRRRAERLPDRARDRGARPVAREVGKERGRAGVDVEDTGHANPDRVRRRAVQSAPADLRQARDDPVRPFVRVRRGRACGRHSRKAVPFDKRPLHVRPAEVEPEVERHRAVHPPSTVRTAPVTNGAVAR